MKIVVLIFFLFLTGCFSGFHRECPNTFNVAWPKLPATIRIINLDPGETEVLELAIQNWNNSLGKEYIKIDPASKNQIMNDDKSFSGNIQGFTIVKSVDSLITNSNIHIRSDLSRDIDLESLYVHELGHFLGLDHEIGTVMNPELPHFVYRIEIEQKVIDSVKCLYENR